MLYEEPESRSTMSNSSELIFARLLSSRVICKMSCCPSNICGKAAHAAEAGQLHKEGVISPAGHDESSGLGCITYKNHE